MTDPDQPRRVLILMSDTGGGHRAAAEAIQAALEARHGTAVSVATVDVFRTYTPLPFKYMPRLYPWWVKRGKLVWRLGYRVSDRRSRARVLMRSISAIIGRGVRRMLLREHAADVIVCVHPIFSTPAMNILRRQPTRPPFLTVVTDLVSTHAFWYDRRVDRLLVPTQPAYERGIKLGVQPERMHVTGLPVHPRFAAGLLNKDEARTRLGWDPTLPAILLVGGGDGVGPLYRIARRINRLGMAEAQFQLAVVAGRNEALYARLKAHTWNQPTHIYPFVTNMPELMAAADLVVSKAGPATISEACMAGLPMILSDAIPGQEDGNVTYITEHRAGDWAPGARNAARTARRWLEEGPEALRARAARARQLARPDAAWEIADEIWRMACLPPIPREPRRLRLRRLPLRRPRLRIRWVRVPPPRLLRRSKSSTK